MMTEYEARGKYRSREVVQTYDENRFVSPQGRLIGAIERDSVGRLMSGLGQPCLILDLACGTGRFTELALNLGNSVVGADISMGMLEWAQRHLGNHDDLRGWLCCDAEKLPFKDNSFDCVIAVRFMNLLPQKARQRMLQEIRRVSRKWAIYNFPNSVSALLLLKATWRIRRRHDPCFYLLSPPALRGELSDAGFEIRQRWSPFLIPPGRFPRFALGMIRLINQISSKLPIRYFSTQTFLLIEKAKGKECTSNGNWD